MPSSTILTPAFLTAAVANFLFFTGLAGFVLPPLHLRQLGATDGQLGADHGVLQRDGDRRPAGRRRVGRPRRPPRVSRDRRRAHLRRRASSSRPCPTRSASSRCSARSRAWPSPSSSSRTSRSWSTWFRRTGAARRSGSSGSRARLRGRGTGAGRAPGPGGGLSRAVPRRGGAPLLAAVISARFRLPPEPRRCDAASGLPGCSAHRLGPRPPDDARRRLRARPGRDVHVLPDLRARSGGSMGGPLRGHLLGRGPRRAGHGGRLADTIGRRAVIIPALALQAGATVLLASLGLLARSLGLPAGPLSGARRPARGRGARPPVPALTALVVDVTPPERRGRVVGVFMAFILLGQATGAAGFGHLAHWVGYGPMFGILSIVLAGACALASASSGDGAGAPRPSGAPGDGVDLRHGAGGAPREPTERRVRWREGGSGPCGERGRGRWPSGCWRDS